MTPALPHRRHAVIRDSRRGFTLIEALCTMTIMSILAVVSFRILFGAADQYTAAAARAELSNELSATMERITGELRQIPAKAASSPAVPNITTITPTSIVWTTPSGVLRTLTLTGTQLLSTETATTSVLMNNVSGFAVQTYTGIGGALATSLSGSGCDTIRRIEITLTGTRSGVTETLRTRVFLRALGAGA